MCCAIRCEAQDIRVVERLADGSFVVSIDGQEFRALGAEKVREIQKLRIDFDAAQKINTELGIQIKEALLQRDLAQAQKALIQQKSDSFEADFNRAKEDSARWHSLFISERELRQESMQFIPHGNKTKFDKFLAFLDSPVFQFSVKAVAPIWTAVRCQ